MDESDSKTRSVKYQYFAAVTGNLIAFCYGSGVGWFSPALPLFLSSKSPLESGPLTVEQVSWIGSILLLGAISGNIVAGYLVTKIGAKHSITIFGFPQLISWILLIFGTEAYHLNISRFAVGFTGGAAQTASSIYIAEIADNEIRGKLSTIYQFNRRFGILFAYIVVSYFDYFKLSVIFIGITILFYALFVVLPSTPHYLLKKNDVDGAERALRLYKGYKSEKDPSYVREIEQLKLVSKSVEKSDGFNLKDLQEPDAFRALTQAWVMAFLTQIAATLIFLTYGTTIAANSGTTISKETATITVGISQMCGTTISSVFIDTKGRKFLLILSLAGCAVSLTGLAVHLYLRSYGFDLSFVHWVPLLCMTLNVLFASLGIIPLRLVCLIESMPIKVRSAGVTIGNFAVNLFSFLIVKVYPLLSVIIQPEGCFAIFGIFCALGIIYVILYVKETKGIDLNVVNDGKPEIEKVATVSVITRL